MTIRGALRFLPTALILLTMAVVVAYPVLIVLAGSFLTEPPRPGATGLAFTLENYRHVFSAAGATPLLNTLIIGVAGSAGAVLTGAMLAWLTARTDVPGKGFAQMSGIMPLFLPSLVGALAWSWIASPNAGFLNMAFRHFGLDFRLDIYSLPGIIFVLALYYAPYSFLFIYSALRLVGPEMEEAAEVHGANRWEVLSQISIPSVLPAILSSTLLTFILVIDNFPVPMVLGKPVGIETLPSAIYDFAAKSPSEPNRSAALGTALTVIVFLMVYLQRLVSTRGDYATVGGKGLSDRQAVRLGFWRWPAFAFIALYAIVAVGMPLFAILQMSLRANQYVSRFSDLFGLSAISLKNWKEVISYEPFLIGFENSLIAGAIAGVTGTIVALLLSFIVYRTRAPGRSSIEYLAMFPIAVPALVLGLGIFWAWLTLPIPLFGTLAILVVAYVVHFLPEGFRSISSSILQIGRDLEESAIICGANRFQAALYIVLPIIRTSLVSTAILLFILSMRELTASVFLVTADTRVLSIVLFEQWSSGRQPRVASISLAYCMTLFVVVLVGRRWLKVAGSH